MELKRAKEVLLNLYDNALGIEQVSRYMKIDFGFVGGMVSLDNHFTADQLEAIATWMRDPEGVVKA